MQSYDVVGYTYKADTYCPEDVGIEVARDIDKTGNTVIGRQNWETTEEYLNRVQGFFGIKDRYDEYSYDSDSFPKVIFADQALEDSDVCCECGEELVER